MVEGCEKFSLSSETKARFKAKSNLVQSYDCYFNPSTNEFYIVQYITLLGRILLLILSLIVTSVFGLCILLVYILTLQIFNRKTLTYIKNAIKNYFNDEVFDFIFYKQRGKYTQYTINKANINYTRLYSDYIRS